MLPMTITCRPSRFPFVLFFMFAKTIHPSPSKNFSLYTYIPIHNKIFLYTNALKTLSLYINMVYKNPITVQRFLFLFFNIHSWFIQKFLYIHSLLTHRNFFSHIIYTHTKSFHTFFTYKELFSFLYI